MSAFERAVKAAANDVTLADESGRSPVILKIIWRMVLRIIWRNQAGLSEALSVKRSMSGHPRNVRQSLAEGAKPDEMIVGR